MIELRFLLVVARTYKSLGFVILIIIPPRRYTRKSTLGLFCKTSQNWIANGVGLLFNLGTNRLWLDIVLQNCLLLSFAFVSSGCWCGWNSSFSLRDEHRRRTLYFLGNAYIVQTRLAQERRLDILAWTGSLNVFDMNKSPLSWTKNAILSPSFLLNHIYYRGYLIATRTWNSINYILYSVFKRLRFCPSVFSSIEADSFSEWMTWRFTQNRSAVFVKI